MAINQHADGRFLAKVALAVGYQLFGGDFLATQYANDLRKGFREADPKKRQQLKILGSGYLCGVKFCAVGEILRWPAGWQIAILRVSERLVLLVTAPTGRNMSIQITDDAVLLDRLGPEYRDGVCWVTVPPARTAIGPLPYQDYIAHKIGCMKFPQLVALEALCGDASALPKTGLEDAG